MPARVSRRLVIDTSVVRSAGGEDAIFPTSKHCRDFLKATLAICHRVVMTPKIVAEWRFHRSNFARQWRASMEARKKVLRIPNWASDELRVQLRRAPTIEKDYDAMLKDLHLIEAALLTDRTIVSLDETARRLFAATARRVGRLKNLVWINPANSDEEPLSWLEDGAKPERKRQLGFQAGES